MSTFSAFVTLLQFPLFVWEAHHVDNAFWVNVFNCLCTILAYSNPLHLMVTPLQKHLVQKELNQTDSGNKPIIRQTGKQERT